MNCLPVEATIDLGSLWEWYDSEPELRCAVFTGAGHKAFCTGIDLKQRLAILETGDVAFEYRFGNMSNRTGKKPIIVAFGGFEIVFNADVIFASPNASFQLPEVLRGVSALAGALPRCMVLFGNHRTMDLCLTGRVLSVEEAMQRGLVKEIVPQDKLLERALDFASEIAALCPDSVIISASSERGLGDGYLSCYNERTGDLR
ncbi:ClpP/crotonase [Hypoxylon sp. EC38]|nr:ClpP/crotonase [Hypoxylon sp. EC38]